MFKTKPWSRICLLCLALICSGSNRFCDEVLGGAKRAEAAQLDPCVLRWKWRSFNVGFNPRHMPGYLDTTEVVNAILRATKTLDHYLDNLGHEIDFSVDITNNHAFWSSLAGPPGYWTAPNPIVQFVPLQMIPRSPYYIPAALAFRVASRKSCEIEEACIWLSSGMHWHADTTQPDSLAFDLESLVLHELLHTLGLEDSRIPGDCMSWSMAPGETRRHITRPTAKELRKRYKNR